MAYLRTLTKHEDDVKPLLVWLVSGYASAFAAGYVATKIGHALGYRSVREVMIVGGGETSYVQMTTAEYYAGFVQILVLFAVLGAWCYRDRRHDRTEES